MAVGTQGREPTHLYSLRLKMRRMHSVPAAWKVQHDEDRGRTERTIDPIENMNNSRSRAGGGT